MDNVLRMALDVMFLLSEFEYLIDAHYILAKPLNNRFQKVDTNKSDPHCRKKSLLGSN